MTNENKIKSIKHWPMNVPTTTYNLAKQVNIITDDGLVRIFD